MTFSLVIITPAIIGTFLLYFGTFSPIPRVLFFPFNPTGMLSKSKGQTLRIAAVLHVLFHWETPTNIAPQISNEAIRDAVTFVDFCIQHACFLCGRKEIREEIEDIQTEGHYMFPMYNAFKGNYFSIYMN